jgi:hypothetical protein
MTVVRCPACSSTVTDPESYAHALDCGGRSQSRRQNHQDALAATTILFHDQAGFTAEAIEQAAAMLIGQPTADLRQAAFGAIWRLAVTLRTLEANDPGFGAEMLHALGLTVAETAG